MAEKITRSGWDPETRTYTDITSKDEYETYEVQATQEDRHSPWREDRKAKTLRLFVHARTGIVVDDVERFEDWLKSLAWSAS